jgi:hypothetical protein
MLETNDSYNKMQKHTYKIYENTSVLLPKIRLVKKMHKSTLVFPRVFSKLLNFTLLHLPSLAIISIALKSAVLFFNN